MFWNTGMALQPAVFLAVYQRVSKTYLYFLLQYISPVKLWF